MSGHDDHQHGGGHGHSHGEGGCCGGHGGEHAEGTSAENMALPADLQAMMELARQLNLKAPRDVDQARMKTYAFWNTQPVPKIDEQIDSKENGAIEPDVPHDKLRKEPYSLPDTFQWSDVDLNDEKQLQELYTLLTENYVEDDDNMFRFDYSADFLKWALQVPGWLSQWHCGVRAKASGKLLAFIGAVPQTVRVYGKTVKMVEINFLCVHKKLRSKRVAPVLIREITRRVNLEGIFQAAFTAGIVIPKPVARCRYFHRSLNPKKLIEVRFSHLSSKMTLARTIKLYKLPEATATSGLRPLEPKDVDSALKLLNKHLEQYKLSPVLNKQEFEHIFTPKSDVVYTYVVASGNKVTDLISFYSLPSSVIGHATHKKINAAYSFYNVANSVPLKQLMHDALILANNAGFDVFNALDLMQNRPLFEELKFGAGDGNLQYYLYNWKCPNMEASDIGLVLQ